MTSPTRSLAENLVTTLGVVDELELSRHLFDARYLPDTHVDRRFCLDIQSQSLNMDREQGSYRARHTVAVRMLFRVNTLDQWATFLDTLDIEHKVKEAVLGQEYLQGANAKYVRTSRSLLPTREYQFVEIVFTVDQDSSLNF